MSVFGLLADAVTVTLGEAVTVQPEGGAPREIRAEFAIKPVEEGEFVVKRPVVTARTADVSDIVDGATVVARVTTYVARDAMPGGEGLTYIILQDA